MQKAEDARQQAGQRLVLAFERHVWAGRVTNLATKHLHRGHWLVAAVVVSAAGHKADDKGHEAAGS